MKSTAFNNVSLGEFIVTCDSAEETILSVNAIQKAGTKIAQLKTGGDVFDIYTPAVPENVATKEWVEGKGYLSAHQSLEGYAKTTDIPKKVSELENDAGYLSAHQSLEGYAKASDIPLSVSQLTNDTGFITSSSLEGYAKTTDIPTKVSVLENDAGYLSAHQSLTGYATQSWVEGKGYLSAHQSLEDYAKTADIPTKVSELENDSGYLSAHQSLTDYAKTADIPTKVSQLENDAGYITEHYVLSAAKDDALGGIKTGFVESDKNYPVKLDADNKAYVNVPWTGGSASDVAVDDVTIGKKDSSENYKIYVKNISLLSGDLTATMATREFVNSSIATSTATFRGTKTSENEISATFGNENDYLFLSVCVAEGNSRYDRYKFISADTEQSPTAYFWAYEYTLNNSSFTSDQWNSINSKITADKVEKLVLTDSISAQNWNTAYASVKDKTFKDLAERDLTSIVGTNVAVYTDGGVTKLSAANTTYDGSDFLSMNEDVAGGKTATTIGSRYGASETQVKSLTAPYSFVNGKYCVASATYAHAEGLSTYATGWYAHSEGCQTSAFGEAAHAEGNATVAGGSYSHAEGDGAKAYGEYSHAAGAAVINADRSWGWSPTAWQVPPARPNTFNVNPDGGLGGFYVGSKSVQTTFNELVNNRIFVCETSAEVAECKDISPSFEDVFKTWTRFGHSTNGTQYGRDAGYPGTGAKAWTYLSAQDTICQPVNTTDFTGFVSRNTYDEYDFTIRCYSSDSDDDYNGIVAAFATDASGYQHTLSFLRTPNNQNGTESQKYHWFCAMDTTYPFNIETRADAGQTLITYNEDLNASTEAKGSWSTKGVGVLVKVRREGNVFKAWTTKFVDGKTSLSASELDYELSVDLDQLAQDPAFESKKDVINLFKSSCPYGYCSFSQANSKYQNIEFADTEVYIIDLQQGKTLRFDKAQSKWVETSISPIDALGAGRFAYNTVTKKQFFNDGAKIYNVSASNSARFASTDKADISDTDGVIDAVKRILLLLGMKESNITV